MNILAELQSRLAAALADLTDDPQPFAQMVRPTQDARFGDYQANCAMPLARQRGVNPRQLADEIVQRLQLDDLCEPPEVAGPGFINLRLRDEWLTQRMAGLCADLRLGVSGTERPRRIVVDYSSPNVAKPMHVGHLRSSVIGDALYRVLRFLGHDVVGDNHIGDWGTQFGMIIYGYKHFLDAEAYARHPVAELARLYRLVNQQCDYRESLELLPQQEQQVVQQQQQLAAAEQAAGDDPGQKKSLKKLRSQLGEREETLRATQARMATFESSADLRARAEAHPDILRATREETARLHAGDAENTRLWEQFLPQCLEALDRVYDRLGIHFDLTLGESHYQPRLGDVVSQLQERGLARESDGAMCVFIAGNDAPFLIQKGDGAFTYATTDLATIQYRVDHLQAEAMLYVVDSRQAEHFKLLFATAALMGYADVDFQYISFGTVMGTDRKPYKTRSGDTVGLESLLQEAVAKAYEIVAANDDAKPDGPELDDVTRRAVAEVVGIGGIKYADLRINRESDYVFDWDTMLNMKGDTATYMQYAYARTRGILRRGGVDPASLQSAPGAISLQQPAERQLALQLARFPDALAAVAADYRPNLLTSYLFETANLFSAFYDQCPVLERGGRRHPREPAEAGRSVRPHDPPGAGAAGHRHL